ncbi:methyl-accepting chemotaxis protein [Spirulina sp. CS-785/01]|uniref:HAMP domain-containing methyl-accepting chemotaxis protein n=1 Tax=Spirulina sp. CS-785/01 TaxID=3021716 RepID=UPI00232EFA10|nr:methyl-accepting chemotaxis protein [Spirulina sp. CS-785/01]MDB9312075.1 methyl-accepting chemotaxis protein [Spirulina sp. CS-785/01]
MSNLFDKGKDYYQDQENIAKGNVNFKLRHWIITGYAIPIVLFIVSGIIVFLNVQTVRKEAKDVQRSMMVVSHIGDIAFNVQTVSRATRGYLLDASTVSLESYRSSRDQVEEQLAQLDELVIHEGQKETLERLVAEIETLIDLNADLIEKVQQGDTEGAIQSWTGQGGREQAEVLSNLLSQFKQRENVLVEENLRDQEKALDQLVAAIGIATGSAIIVAIIAGTLIINNVSRRMNETASNLATSSSEIASTIEEQERTASQQAASVNETTTTMDELGASSQQSAEQAEAAATAAKRALELADGGTQAVSQTLDGMNALKEKVSAIAEQILRLSEQTNQIGMIAQLVADLANQTNMLALNAAVEAVRAGEHGKGFSVVATEIRKLADRSKQSTQKINDLVADIQHSINSTVMVTDEGTKTVEDGVEITQKTADAFDGVAEAVNNVVLNNQQISLNIKQQASAIQQVVQAMNTINQGAQESASGITQTKLGTQKLNEATQVLKNMV